MALHYYAQRKFYKDGVGKTPLNYHYETVMEAEKQFHLLCSSAITNNDGNDFDSVEFGTLENGIIERKFYNHPVLEPAPEPEE